MIETIGGFKRVWQAESALTYGVLSGLPEDAGPWRSGGRCVAEIAWHITCSMCEIGSWMGVGRSGPGETTTMPGRLPEIAQTYRHAAAALLADVTGQWSDSDLRVVDEVYGERWARGHTLYVLLAHEIHHRGQMQALLRAGGYPVAAIYGPPGV